ncbi:MAG: SidA/IucD/PvdA family monooxygenase [Proteobacteria bacterium]|nr:SidA/IucD/PvdA family monooxygenase [Pseudomonadota bacterium]
MTSHRLIVVGAGPKAMAIAAKADVLRRLGLPAPEVHIVERTAVGAHWTGRSGYTDGKLKLGTSPEKDVGFPYDSVCWGPDLDERVNRAMHEYSWQSFLISENLYADWVDRGRPAPEHRVWAQYLVWVSKRLGEGTVFHQGDVKAVDRRGERWVVRYGAAGAVEEIDGDGLVLTGPGRTKFPSPLLTHERVLTAETFWKVLPRMERDSAHIAVVGTGETAASIALSLASIDNPSLSIDIVSPHAMAYSRGESFLENRVYSNPENGRWERLTLEDRRNFINRTDRGVFSLYAQRLLDQARAVEIVPGRLRELSPAGPERVEARVEYDGRVETREYDYVVIATGGDPLAIVRELGTETALAGLASLADPELERGIDRSLAVRGAAPRLHVPMLSALAQGPGFANLSCLGRLSDRILEPYVREPIEEEVAMNTGTISIATPSDVEEINRIRMEEYGKAKGFSVKPAGILWNRSDDQSTVLALKERGELIATMRLELVEEIGVVERKMECKWVFEPVRFPVMILSKAATRSGLQGRGLNAVLRYHALKIAAGWGARQMLGTFIAGSPRENSMRAMGYRFFRNEEGWFKADYQAKAPVTVAVLDLEADLERALAECARIAGAEIERFAWSGPAPERKLVTVVK